MDSNKEEVTTKIVVSNKEVTEKTEETEDLVETKEAVSKDVTITIKIDTKKMTSTNPIFWMMINLKDTITKIETSTTTKRAMTLMNPICWMMVHLK